MLIKRAFILAVGASLALGAMSSPAGADITKPVKCKQNPNAAGCKVKVTTPGPLQGRGLTVSSDSEEL